MLCPLVLLKHSVSSRNRKLLNLSKNKYIETILSELKKTEERATRPSEDCTRGRFEHLHSRVIPTWVSVHPPSESRSKLLGEKPSWPHLDHVTTSVITGKELCDGKPHSSHMDWTGVSTIKEGDVTELEKGCWAERNKVPFPVLRVFPTVTQGLHPPKKSLLFFLNDLLNITPQSCPCYDISCYLLAWLSGLFWWQLKFPSGVLLTSLIFRGKALCAGELGHKAPSI